MQKAITCLLIAAILVIGSSLSQIPATFHNAFADHVPHHPADVPPPKGVITIEKQTVNEIPPKTGFSFAGSFGSFDLKDNQKKLFDKINAGTYTVNEIVPSGWVFSLVMCSIKKGNLSTFSQSVSGVVINLAEDEDVQCVFVDIKLSISIPVPELSGAGGCRETWIVNAETVASGETNFDYRRCVILDLKPPVFVDVIQTTKSLCLKVIDDVGVEKVVEVDDGIEFKRWAGAIGFFCISQPKGILNAQGIDFAGNMAQTTLYPQSKYATYPHIDSMKKMLLANINKLDLNLFQKDVLTKAIAKYPYDLTLVEKHVLVYAINQLSSL